MIMMRMIMAFVMIVSFVVMVRMGLVVVIKVEVMCVILVMLISLLEEPAAVLGVIDAALPSRWDELLRLSCLGLYSNK